MGVDVRLRALRSVSKSNDLERGQSLRNPLAYWCIIALCSHTQLFCMLGAQSQGHSMIARVCLNW